jgi:hypothetical protein
MNHDQKNRTTKKQSCGNDGAVESLENQNQVFHPSHRPLEIAPRFPHSHSSGDDSFFLMKLRQNRVAAGLRPWPTTYRVVVIDREK